MTSRRKQHKKPAAPRQGKTAECLIDAAIDEFNSAGFHGTDTNRIARRAGFAPQTFYRWFDDKMGVFLAAYRRWEEEENSTISSLLDRGATPAKVATALIAHHRKYKIFRRSLRHISLEDERARQARAESRVRQLARLRAALPAGAPAHGMTDAALAAWLLQLERLCDAAAEDEFKDLRISRKDAQDQTARHIARAWTEASD